MFLQRDLLYFSLCVSSFPAHHKNDKGHPRDWALEPLNLCSQVHTTSALQNDRKITTKLCWALWSIISRVGHYIYNDLPRSLYSHIGLSSATNRFHELLVKLQCWLASIMVCFGFGSLWQPQKSQNPIHVTAVILDIFITGPTHYSNQ